VNFLSDWAQFIIGGVVAFVFKVVFGLITKNEVKSDEQDRRLEGELKQMDERYRNNDRELYRQCSDLNGSIKSIEARLPYIEGKK
jgi:flagellar capping protein FliD